MTNVPRAMGTDISAEAVTEAETALRAGDRARAYEHSLKATQIDPENQAAWLLRAESAGTIEEAVDCLNRANALQPSDAHANPAVYRVVQRLLAQDPFLLYMDETDAMYHVRSGAISGGQEPVLTVPKDRAVPEPYPARRPAQLQKAYRWLWLAFLGLPLAGLGAILFAPPAAAAAMGLYLREPSGKNRIYSLVVMLLAGGVWLVGLLLGVILLMHIISR